MIIQSRETIIENIRRIVTTEKGSVFFNRGYGCEIHKLQFETNAQILQSIGSQYIRDAIEMWEKRVKVISVVFASENEKMKIKIKCQDTQIKDTFDVVI